MWSEKRPFFSQRRFWSPIFGHINTTFMWVSDDILFCWKSNCKDSNWEVIGPLFTWIDLNEIENLIKERWMDFLMSTFQQLNHLSHQDTPHMETKQKCFLKWHKNQWWRSLIFTLVETLYGSVMMKQSFRRLESVPTWFGWENTICHLKLHINAFDFIQWFPLVYLHLS